MMAKNKNKNYLMIADRLKRFTRTLFTNVAPPPSEAVELMPQVALGQGYGCLQELDRCGRKIHTFNSLK